MSLFLLSYDLLLFLLLLSFFGFFFSLTKKFLRFYYRFFKFLWVYNRGLGKIIFIQALSHWNYLKDLPFCSLHKQIYHLFYIPSEFFVFKITLKNNTTIAFLFCKSTLNQLNNELIIWILIIFFIERIFLFPLSEGFFKFLFLSSSFL